MNILRLLLLLAFMHTSNALSGGIISEATKQIPDAKIFTTIVEEKQKKLEELKELYASLQEEESVFLYEVKANAQEIKSKIQVVQRALVHDPQNEFYIRQLALLNELDQVLKEIVLVWEKVVAQVDSHIKNITEFLQDPDLKKYKNELLKDTITYSFEYFQQVHQWLSDQEKKLDDIKEKLANASVGLESRKRAYAATLEEHEKRKKEFGHEGSREGVFSLFDPQQRARLWALEETLFKDKKKLDQLRIQEIEYKIEVLKLKQFIARLRRDVIKDVVRTVKSAIRISEADVSLVRDELAKKKQESFTVRNRYRQEIEKLSVLQKQQEQALTIASKQYNSTLDKDLDEWNKIPKETVDAHLGLYIVSNLNDALLLTKRKKDLLSAQLALEEELIRYQDIVIEVKDSFRKITVGSLLSEDQVAHEQKKYDGLKAEIKAIAADITARQNSATELLSRQKRALDSVKKRREELAKIRYTIFRNNLQEYNQCIELLNSAQEKIRAQIDIINKMISAYTDVINAINKSMLQLDFIVAELARVPVVWHRPEYAITWEGIKNIYTDIHAFFSDIIHHGMQINVASFMQLGETLYHDFGRIIVLILKLVFCLFLLLVAHKAFFIFASFLVRVPEAGWGIRALSLFGVALIYFMRKYFTWITVWVMCFLTLHLYIITDPYVYIFFYLLSIPYVLYLAYCLIQHLHVFNKKYDHIFWSLSFEPRFITILATVLYSTIVIVFFREAFILGNYRRSELPTILLAINFIILQVSLIALIAKELVLNIIPTRTEWWRYFYTYVDRYYYLILVIITTIVVMSNPYVGFGRLALYLLSRVIYTTLIIFGLFWLQVLCKKVISHLLFVYEQDVAKERFAQSKTWYSFAVIGIFLSCIFFGFLFLAKIWSWPETLNKITHWNDLVELIKTPFILENTESPISVFSILYILLFIVSGTFIVFLLNRFVLERIYEMLSVDTGVRNTVSSLMRYVILTTAVILGFKAVGLVSLVTYMIGALIIGIGWVVKDPIGDVLAYFIILVQRPLKVGDYVQLDDQTMGVVRKITPRSVIIRKKNSTTIVVPNNMALNKPIVNWNYVRGFIAFDDIIITISYEADPEKTRMLLLRIVEDNQYILRHPKPVVRLDHFADHGYQFMVRGYINSNYTLDMWDIASDIRLTIVKTLQAHDIKIAIPIRMLYDSSLKVKS